MLTIREAAKRLGLQETSLRKFIRQGRIPVVRVWGAVRVRPEDIEQIIRDGYREAKHD
ncbi:MAG: helix-turn-helix domain-containing protein [Nitrospirae bacterium]|nr:helix-turn-helix domain-containing protein [Nitrospirota bacterium]